MPHAQLIALTLLLSGLCACDDDHTLEADQLGIGAACAHDSDCALGAADGGESERCLLQFKGGYCGLTDCASSLDCPQGSACVHHGDGRNYCFRICTDKAECNLHRGPDEESNCSANVDFVAADKASLGKACVPPSSS